MALSRVVSEIFNVEKCRDLEIRINSHSRSLKVVPFDRLCMVSCWCSLVTLSLKRIVFLDIRLVNIVTLKPGLESLKVIENDTIRSGTHNFLFTFHSNHRPISHRFRDKRRFPSKIANFSNPVYLTPPLKRFP